MEKKAVLENLFPVWNKLDAEQRESLLCASSQVNIKQGTVLQDASSECRGLYLIESGRLRAFIISETGKEITLYRLFNRDLCLFTATCMMKNIQFDMSVEAERDTRMLIIPVKVYQNLMEKSAVLANFTNEIMASRFSEVMWLLDKVMFKGIDSRLASFLIEESLIEGEQTLFVTQERIAGHIGTAREVITRMLKYFQDEGAVRLFRGGIEITDAKKLSALSK
ncbi:MAG: Crp/Fnr family transcriptional regulator [Oscillospiraceae bacterium]